VKADTPLGWGVVGTGDVSRCIATDLALLDSARLVAVASRSAGSTFATQLGFERHGSFDDLLRDSEVDIVYLGTPHSTHASLAVAALEAGKHVLVEKPLGVNAAEVEHVVAAARAAGRFAMEGMWMKFHPYYRALLDEVRGGSICDVTAVRASFGLPFGERDSSRWSASLASSTLLDQGIYPVTLAHDLLGEPASVLASADLRDDGVDVRVEATLQYAGGRFAHVAASMVGFLEPTAAVSGTRGWIDIAAPFWATDRYTRHAGDLGEALMKPVAVSFGREGFGYVPMLRAVDEAVRSGLLEHPIHPFSSTVAVARTLDRIRVAAATSHQTETAS
jgi:predicted dehydrogenase